MTFRQGKSRSFLSGLFSQAVISQIAQPPASHARAYIGWFTSSLMPRLFGKYSSR